MRNNAWKRPDFLTACTLMFLILLFLIPQPGYSSQQKIKEKDLPLRYKEFMKLVRYIMLDQERDVFLQLTGDRDREAFVETFWKQRDPTPGTPQNEYQEEHMERVKYANTILGRSAPRDGWMTDQGRYHIILGKPNSIDRFDNIFGIYPVQVWYYFGDARKGLPTYYALVFWKRGGTGEWKLYDPVSDGPSRLLIHREGIAPEDYEQWYDKIRQLAPTLADVSISNIPGEIPYNYQPSPRNIMLLADIQESPKKDINPKYATHFLNYKGMVTSEYMTNYIECEAQVNMIRDPLTDLDFLHYSIVPKQISIDYYEPRDQYFCNFTVNASLRVEDNIIFQHTREFPFYFDPDDIDNVRGNGISIEDSFPSISGRYKLIILLQNSVGKEFSVHEQDIMVPDRTELPRMSTPLVGYRLRDYETTLHIPYKILDKKLVIDPKSTFGSKDNISFFFTAVNINQDIWENGEIKLTVSGMKPVDPIKKSYTIQLKNQPFRKLFLFTHSIPGADLKPDYYEMKITLLDSGGENLDERKSNFVISPVEAVSHPISYSKAIPQAGSFLFFYMQAHQFEKMNRLAEAEESYRKAYEKNSDHIPGLVEFAGFLIKVGKFADGMDLVAKIKDDEKHQFDYYLIRGKALMGTGNFAEAISSFLEGNKIYNSDVSLLNSLGYCYYRVEEYDKALDALQSSLRLNSEQEGIKNLKMEIESKKK
jgi:GWxTD domain-containing protein